MRDNLAELRRQRLALIEDWPHKP